MKKQSPGRVAFLLNAHAKSVTPQKRRALAKLIPAKDFYVSSSIEEAEAIMKDIIAKRYSYIFSGGGDGTIIGTINMLKKLSDCVPEHEIPRIGILRLGTGNAMAHLLGAKNPEEDIEAILQGKSLKPVSVSMVETSEGMLAPFAGIGYDGELMNDFEAVKKVFAQSPFKNFFTSFLGFTIAGFFKTLPRQKGRKLPLVKLRSGSPAYRIISVDGKDEEIFLNEGLEIYQGVAPLICVGTIPFLGYGIKMFPFAHKRPGYMHLRVSAVPIATCLSHFYPGIWHGTFRHPELYDFLVKDVHIESNEDLPYQFAGDAMGHKKKLFFKISENPVLMASLQKQKHTRISGEPLLMPLR